jgi:hypothetical protein
MYKKIATSLQLSDLKIGDIITRYPTDGEPTDVFDNDQPRNTDVFQVRSLSINKVLELIAPDRSVPVFASAGDVRRLFMRSEDILSDNVWWLQSAK